MSSTPSKKNQTKASRPRNASSTSSASASKSRGKLPKLKSYKINGVLVTESSGNIWHDLGYPDAEERQAKADLAFAIRHRVEALGLTQTAAAKRLGLTPPRMSEIFNLHVQGYTTARL